MLVVHSAADGTWLAFSRARKAGMSCRLCGDGQHLGAHQRPGQVGAEHRDHDTEADEHRTPMADDGLEDAANRRLAHCAISSRGRMP